MTVSSRPSATGRAQRQRRGWRDWAQLVRIGTVITGAGLCLIGARFPDDPLDGRRTTAATLCVAFLIVFAQVVNDVFDVEVDRLQGRSRPLVGGAIGVNAARTLAIAAGAAGLAAAFVLGWRLFAVAVAVLVVSWVYSCRLKDSVGFGNVTVALLASAPIVFGAAANGRIGGRAWIAQAVVFLFMVAFEVVKTGRDLSGDRAGGLRTVATVHGLTWTCRVAGSLSIVFVLAVALAATVAREPIPYAIVMLGAAALAGAAGAQLLRSRGVPEDVRRPLDLLRAAWLPGIVALVFL